MACWQTTVDYHSMQANGHFVVSFSRCRRQSLFSARLRVTVETKHPIASSKTSVTSHAHSCKLITSIFQSILASSPVQSSPVQSPGFIPSPDNVLVAVKTKAWMDVDLMSKWFKGVVLLYTKGRRALLSTDYSSANEDQDFMAAANKNDADVVIIPGSCTSKIQPLDVCLNKPFKSLLRSCWQEYIDSIVSSNPNLMTASKEEICQWSSKVI